MQFHLFCVLILTPPPSHLHGNSFTPSPINSRSLGMEPVVEVVSEQEMDAAIAAGAKIVGINNRDLTTFKVDLGRTDLLMRYAGFVLREKMATHEAPSVPGEGRGGGVGGGSCTTCILLNLHMRVCFLGVHICMPVDASDLPPQSQFKYLRGLVSTLVTLLLPYVLSWTRSPLSASAGSTRAATCSSSTAPAPPYEWLWWAPRSCAPPTPHSCCGRGARAR